jgi:hypothetical protein
MNAALTLITESALLRRMQQFPAQLPRRYHLCFHLVQLLPIIGYRNRPPRANRLLPEGVCFIEPGDPLRDCLRLLDPNAFGKW